MARALFAELKPLYANSSPPPRPMKNLRREGRRVFTTKQLLSLLLSLLLLFCGQKAHGLQLSLKVGHSLILRFENELDHSLLKKYIYRSGLL